MTHTQITTINPIAGQSKNTTNTEAAQARIPRQFHRRTKQKHNQYHRRRQFATRTREQETLWVGIEERTVVGVGVNGPPGVDVDAGPDLRPLHTQSDSRRRGEPQGRGEFGRQRSPSTELACDGSPGARRVRAARGGASWTTADGGREGRR